MHFKILTTSCDLLILKNGLKILKIEYYSLYRMIDLVTVSLALSLILKIFYLRE